MAGAINFAMTDVYGGIWGTTETTIPEANDQQALVDDQKAADDPHDNQLPPAADKQVLQVFKQCFQISSS